MIREKPRKNTRYIPPEQAGKLAGETPFLHKKIIKSHQISPKHATKNAIRSRKVADQAENGVERQKPTQKKKQEIKEEDLVGEVRKGEFFVEEDGRGAGGVWVWSLYSLPGDGDGDVSLSLLLLFLGLVGCFPAEVGDRAVCPKL